MTAKVFFIIVLIIAYLGSVPNGTSQQLSDSDFVTYSRNSSFIKEIESPVDDFGLRGIATDVFGNVWFHHSTNESSTIFKLNTLTNQFTKYEINEKTQASNAIISLTGGQLTYDKHANSIWFTDARTNSIGKLDLESEEITLYKIPTLDAGPMGLVLSSDNTTLWFTELNANKISSLDILSGKITEYMLKENSGPTLLAFDKDDFLWVTMSYSNSVLKINLENLASGGESSITELKLPKGDVFSPFGISIISVMGDEKLVISDHGSSRVIVSDISSNLSSYSSYWTSESAEYPQTLPGQIVSDGTGNVFFPQHGGNKISKIDIKTGTMIEYDIPTGPLSTVVYIALDQNGRVWFPEVLSNKIAYLDTSIPIPMSAILSESLIKIKEYETKHLSLQVEYGNLSSPLLADEIQISLAGMTHSGITEVSYDINPETINLNDGNKAQSTISISPKANTKSGSYNIMIQVTTKEESDKDLNVSILRPLDVLIDMPKSIVQDSKQTSESDLFSAITLKDIIQTMALSVAVGLSALIVLRRIKLRTSKTKTND